MVGAKFGYFAATPTAGKMAAKMSERNANYLAHEFLNEHWTPFYSSDVADEMANAKLNFVGSATLAENHLELLGGDDGLLRLLGVAIELHGIVHLVLRGSSGPRMHARSRRKYTNMIVKSLYNDSVNC